MAAARKEPEFVNAPSGQACDQEAGVSSKEEEEDNRHREDREEDSIKRLIHLQKDLTTSVTNIQTEADAKLLLRQAQVEETHRVWGMRLEHDAKSSREKCEIITSRWSLVTETMIPQELQKTLDSQRQLYAAIIEDKKKLIGDLLQVLKAGDNSYVEILKKNTEEIDLMEKMMNDGKNSLTKAYREELAVTETVQQQEFEALLLEKSKLDDDLLKLWELELERLMERQKTMDDYEEQINKKIWECFDITNSARMECLAQQQKTKKKSQRKKESASCANNHQRPILKAYERRQQQFTEFSLLSKLTLIQQDHQEQLYSSILLSKEQEILSLQAEMKNLKLKDKTKTEELAKKHQHLTKEHKRCLQQYERTLKKVKRLKIADANQIEEVWHTTDAEVKLLAERALKMDSMICENHLGLTWEHPSIAASARVQPQTVEPKAAQSTAFQHSLDTMEASAGTLQDTDSEVETHKEEGGMTIEAQKTVIKLFCDEAGFLVEDKLLKLLDHLGEEELLDSKLKLLLCELGIKDKDFPKLIHFLWMYNKPAEDVVGSPSCDIVESIHANDVLPALKSFLEQNRRSRVSTTSRQEISWHKRVQNTSEGLAYWESFPNLIPEDKLQLLDAAESLFMKYSDSLAEFSNLVAEINLQKQLNAELWNLLHQ